MADETLLVSTQGPIVLVGSVVAEAGPRWRGELPRTIDAVRSEREEKRAIVEPLFWPWEAEWPVANEGKRPWGHLPQSTTLVPGEPHGISLALENRGDAPAQGRYRLRVVPASAAKIVGPRELSADLKPGGRAAVDTAVVATGAVNAFSIEAVAEGPGLTDTCLFFQV